jgi:hypothetical protein
VLDHAGDGVQQKRQRGCREGGEPGADERGKEGDEGERSQDADQRDAEHIGRQREDGGAMEGERHRQDHDSFGDQADEGEFGGVESDADKACGERAEVRADSFADGFAPNTEHHAELGEVRREGCVAPAVVEVAGGARVGQEAAFGHRHGDAGDADNGEEGHLEAGLKERARRPDEDRERGGSERVERVAVAREQARKQEDGGHQQGALHGHAEAGEQRVGGDKRQRERGCEGLAKPQAASEVEEQAGEQRNVHSGDDEEMEGAGTLEAEAQGVAQA